MTSATVEHLRKTPIVYIHKKDSSFSELLLDFLQLFQLVSK